VDAEYNGDLTHQILETLMGKLHEHNKPFKYMTTCMVMQRNGAGLHSSTSCHFDTVNDGALTFMWPKKESKESSKTLVCLVTVFGMEL